MIPDTFRELRADQEDRSAFRRVRALCMTQDDVVAFSDGLKAALPAIRFVSVDYWQQFVDQPRWEADCLESRRREKLGLPRMDVRRYMRDPTSEPLHYWDSLADPRETRFYAWAEPPGWRPVWGPENKYGERFIENTPRLWFRFNRGTFMRRWPGRRLLSDVEPEPTSQSETLLLEGYQFEVRWNPNEPKAEAFGKKVYNVLRKLTDCRFKVFEPENRKAYRDEIVWTQKQCLAGRHALAWTLKRRHNYLQCDNWVNLLKSANYRLRRGDMFTKAQYRKFVADQEARDRENERLRLEGLERIRGQPGDIQIESRGGKVVSVRRIPPKAGSGPTTPTTAAAVRDSPKSSPS